MKNFDVIPKHLSREAQALWDRLQSDFDLTDAAAKALLRQACESYDRAESARRIVRAEGMVIRDRFGQQRPHPMLNVERDARAAVVSAIRALRLAPEVV